MACFVVVIDCEVLSSSGESRRFCGFRFTANPAEVFLDTAKFFSLLKGDSVGSPEPVGMAFLAGQTSVAGTAIALVCDVPLRGDSLWLLGSFLAVDRLVAALAILGNSIGAGGIGRKCSGMKGLEALFALTGLLALTASEFSREEIVFRLGL